MKYASQDAGAQIDAEALYFLCKSFQAWTDTTDNKVYCVNPTKSVTDVTKSTTLGEKMCNYTTFQTTSDWTKGTDAQSNSYCGFNKDGGAWCPQYKGDAQYTAYVSKATDALAFDFTKCSLNSLSALSALGGYAENGCVELNKANESALKALTTQAAQASWVVGADQSWALVANNDGCIKTMITVAYYGAYASSIYATLVVAATSIFYML